MTVAVAGAGPVAQALGRALHESGIPVSSIASRDPRRAQAAARFVGPGVRPVSYREIPRRASHVVIAVSDRAIRSVAEELAAGGAGLRMALHTCGAYGPEPLAPLQAAGVSCGVLHPLQTIADPPEGAAALRGAYFAVSGDPGALAWAQTLVVALDGRALRISPGARPLYHAAAVMAANYIAALLDASEQLMRLAGVPPEDALPALAPLARAGVENVFRRGALQALTGPVARGDYATVAEHVRALRAAGDPVARLYRAAGLHALDMARRRGLPPEDAERVRRALLERE